MLAGVLKPRPFQPRLRWRRWPGILAGPSSTGRAPGGSRGLAYNQRRIVGTRGIPCELVFKMQDRNALTAKLASFFGIGVCLAAPHQWQSSAPVVELRPVLKWSKDEPRIVQSPVENSIQKQCNIVKRFCKKTTQLPFCHQLRAPQRPHSGDVWPLSGTCHKTGNCGGGTVE